MGDRDQLLSSTDPEQLFGTLEPRELRRAYARLAREWRDDDEVAAHLKALFELARTGAIAKPDTDAPAPNEDSSAPEQPQTPLLRLDAALRAGDPKRVIHELTYGYRALLSEDQRPLLHGLSFAIHAYGDALDAEERRQLLLILEDPEVVLPPAIDHRYRQTLAVLAELESLLADDALQPLGRCLHRSWGHDLPTVARCWLEAADELRGTDLEVIFERFEVTFPGCFGRWAWLEQQMLEALPTSDVELDAGLEDRYVSSKGRGQAATELAWRQVWGRVPFLGALDARGRQKLRVALGGLAMVGVFVATSLPREAVHRLLRQLVGLGFLPFMAISAVLLYVLLLPRLRRTKAIQVATRAAEGGDEGELLDVARRLSLFPRELAARLYDRPNLNRSIRGYRSTHAVLRMDRSPWALLAVLTPAHVARLEVE